MEARITNKTDTYEWRCEKCDQLCEMYWSRSRYFPVTALSKCHRERARLVPIAAPKQAA